MSDKEGRARSMALRLFDEYEPAKGGQQIDTRKLLQVVSNNPEAVAEALPTMLRMARAGAAIWGLLLTTAQAYKAATQDDSLEVAVAAEMRKAGVKGPDVVGSPAMGSSRGTEAPKLVRMQVALQDLASGSAFRMARLFRFSPESRVTLEALVGRATLEFPLDHDPRPIWHIPEVRRFMLDLHTTVPHFAMFLDFTPKLSMFLTYYGTLGESSAISSEGSRVMFDMLAPSVVRRVTESLVAIRSVCKDYGLQYRPIAQGIVQSYPPSDRARLFPMMK
jgi:hypothetical protein